MKNCSRANGRVMLEREKLNSNVIRWKKEMLAKSFFLCGEKIKNLYVLVREEENIPLMRRIVALINVRRMRNDATFHRAHI
jgi:hypothetical protein